MTNLERALRNLVTVADKCIPSDECSNKELAEADEVIQNAYSAISELDEKPESSNKDEPQFYTVCIYYMERCYGGPEEGGWWFDRGTPCVGWGYPIPIVCRTLDEAQADADKLQKWVDENHPRQRPIGSVLSTGVYVPHISEGFPTPFPAETPHYE